MKSTTVGGVRLTGWRVWLNAATVVLTTWLAALFLSSSVLPGLGSDAVAILGLIACIVLFGIGFALFARDQKRS